jgi:NADH:ubiquinone oxidoreductase subunit E
MVTSEMVSSKFGIEQALFNALDQYIETHNAAPDSLIEVLHRAQEMFGYLRDDVLQHVADKLSLPASRVYGVATFYHLFHLKPRGKWEILVCLGTACYVRGAEGIVNAIEKTLDVKMGETTSDGLFTINAARCIGACGIAPTMRIGNDVHGKVESKRIKRILRNYQ